jgi:uncharacterized protein
MMMRTILYRLPLVAIWLLMATMGQAQLAGQECFPKKENKLVYDVADLLNEGEESMLESMLVSFADSTSNQITVVIVPDLCGMEKGQFAIELGELWGVGQAKEDNGIVMLVKPKTTESKGEIFIAVGRGLEGAIPDITTKQIIDNECIPSFKNEAYYEGIQAGAAVLMQLARGEYDSDAYASKHTKRKKKGGLGIALLALLIFAFVFIAKAAQTKRYAQTNQIGFWAAWALLNAASRSHHGYYNNFSSGRGGFGGFGGGRGGGGFGGFGGGGFGGGGAGGSW